MFLRTLFSLVPKDEYSRALDLFNSGHYGKALKKLEALLVGRQDNQLIDVATLELYACEAHVALSAQYASEGNIPSALRELQEAVALKPRFADLRYNLGKFHVELGNYTNAQECFRKALEINPKFFKARVYLSRALLACGNAEDAAKELEATGEFCPNFYRKALSDLVQALRINADEDELDDLFHEILEERPSSAQISREIAIEAIQNGNYAEAIRELKKAITLQPDYPDLHNYLGIAYGDSGMVDDAIEEFEIALKINPKYIKALLNLALVLYENGRFLEAEKYIEDVLKMQPENQLANNLLSELHAVKDRN